MKQRYDSYKPSGIDWIGDIPEHWEIAPLKFKCSLKGRIGWNGLKSDEFQESAYAYLVTGQDFKGADIDWSKCYQIDKWRYDEDPFIQLANGDILITKDGTIGKIAKVSDLDKPACLNSGIFVMKQLGSYFSQQYLYWILVSPQLLAFNNYVAGQGTTIQHLYQNVFENMPLLVPPLAEQEAIAAWLDEKCAEIDAAIAKVDHEIELIDELKQSEISRVVTRGLNPNATLRPSGIDWIGDIPEHWSVVRLARLLDGIQDGTHATLPRVEDGELLLSAKNVFEQGIQISENESKISKYDYLEIVSNGFPKLGDVVLCCVATIGRGCIYPYTYPLAFQRSVTFLRINNRYSNKFVLYYLRSISAKAQFDTYAKTSAQSGVYMGDLKRFNILLPPLVEQEAIAAWLDKKCAEIDGLKAKLRKKREALAELRQSLISEVVTGKRKVV